MVQRIVQDVLVSPETSWSRKGAFRTKSGTRKLQSVAFSRDIWGITGIRWNAEISNKAKRLVVIWQRKLYLMVLIFFFIQPAKQNRLCFSHSLSSVYHLIKSVCMGSFFFTSFSFFLFFSLFVFFLGNLVIGNSCLQYWLCFYSFKFLSFSF